MFTSFHKIFFSLFNCLLPERIFSLARALERFSLWWWLLQFVWWLVTYVSTNCNIPPSPSLSLSPFLYLFHPLSSSGLSFPLSLSLSCHLSLSLYLLLLSLLHFFSLSLSFSLSFISAYKLSAHCISVRSKRGQANKPLLISFIYFNSGLRRGSRETFRNARIYSNVTHWASFTWIWRSTFEVLKTLKITKYHKAKKVEKHCSVDQCFSTGGSRTTLVLQQLTMVLPNLFYCTFLATKLYFVLFYWELTTKGWEPLLYRWSMDDLCCDVRPPNLRFTCERVFLFPHELE